MVNYQLFSLDLSTTLSIVTIKYYLDYIQVCNVPIQTLLGSEIRILKVQRAFGVFNCLIDT